MKKLKIYLRKLLLYCLKKLDVASYTNYQVNSIHSLLLRKVFNLLPVRINEVLYVGSNSDLEKLVFQILFVDGNQMIISLSIRNNDLDVGLISTTITDYFLLGDILQKTSVKLGVYSNEILGYFMILKS